MHGISGIRGLRCSKCGKKYDHQKVNQLCSCGAPLLVDYDFAYLKKHFRKEDLQGRENTLWRYREVLPVEKEDNVISLGEGVTPLQYLEKVSKKYDINKLYIKDEGVIPTGTFKARGAAVGISKAKELGIKDLAMPTNGNAGAAWAVYAAKAGIEAHIVMPEGAPEITRNESIAAGADVHLVKGLISDCGKIVARSIEKNGWFDASTLKEPYRIEGKKTMGYEIVEQLNFELPDVILYPTGGGVGLIGIYKALKEMKQLGWIEGKFPRLVAVQAEGCAPIVKAYEQGKKESEFYKNSETVAFGINVPKALGDFLILEAIYETGGCAIAVNDDEIKESIVELASLEGEFICPEGAAVFSAIKKLREKDWITAEDKVVLLNTGAGIKYPDTLTFDLSYCDVDGTIS